MHIIVKIRNGRTSKDSTIKCDPRYPSKKMSRIPITRSAREAAVLGWAYSFSSAIRYIPNEINQNIAG